MTRTRLDRTLGTSAAALVGTILRSAWVARKVEIDLIKPWNRLQRQTYPSGSKCLGGSVCAIIARRYKRVARGALNRALNCGVLLSGCVDLMPVIARASS
jgi:hypothetical protein